MTGGNQLLDEIVITLRDIRDQSQLSLYLDVFDNSLSRKWLRALNDLLDQNLHLEKNYCFLGFAENARNSQFLCDRINASIAAINAADIGYEIHDHFTPDNTIQSGPVGGELPGLNPCQEHFNTLHRYFEDLQGVSGNLSKYYLRADAATRWHIRQLNLLCHEYECWIMSNRKRFHQPEWQRPSQLMCWLEAPRYELDQDDYKLFGIDTIARPTGGVFVGVNKAVGKHHWEVFQDEGRDSRLGELTTTAMKSQTEAAGDFDIEWGQDPSNHDFMIKRLADFRQWLIANKFDPDDPGLTIGHPQVAQVNLHKSFGTKDTQTIWTKLQSYLDVSAVQTSDSKALYDYHWSDDDHQQRQIDIIRKRR